MKKKILFVYPRMMLGGSTTALISLLNCLDPEKYSVDLQLLRNRGELLGDIPNHVNLLPEAEIYKGARGRAVKIIKFIFSGYAFKAIFKRLTKGSSSMRAVLGDFQSKLLSRKSAEHYDVAIGFLEGWSDRYIAFNVDADRKYGWLHSTFSKITNDPRSELGWMQHVDKIACVTDACRDEFVKILPQMAEKAVTVANITDSEVIRRRSESIDRGDAAYKRFSEFEGFRIITVCRLTVSVKGLDRIVECVKKLKAAGKDFLWYVVGDGEDKELFEQLIKQADVGDRLVAIGKRMNPYPYIKISDVMCMPSRYEGRPITVTESMILGTPPVVTEYLSANEQIKNGTDGIVVENADNTVAEALLYCMDNRKEVNRMKEYLISHEYGNGEYVREIEKDLFSM